MKKLILFLAAAVLAWLGVVPTSFAQSDCSKLISPSPFGSGDQIGAAAGCEWAENRDGSRRIVLRHGATREQRHQGQTEHRRSHP